MNISMPLIRKCACALFAAAVAVSAAPQVSVDNTTFSGGAVKENSVVKASFKLTNTGDDTLRVVNVRPGCGCTVVSYDSVIAPGKSGFIRPEVNLKGMGTGHRSRGVTVTSNAANTPTLNLTIEMNIEQTVEISEGYLILTAADTKTVSLTSPKKDLKVTAVLFTPQGGGANMPNWAENAPINLTYKFTQAGTKDGLRTYNLSITPPNPGGDVINGTFQITTNHPDRKEIVVSGRVQ